MEIILLICMAIAFITVAYITPWTLRYLRRIGLVVKDQNKKDKPLVPISGGMAVLSGFFLGVMAFIFINTFFVEKGLNNTVLMYLLSSLISIIMITFVGFIDDLMIRDDQESSSGLKQWQKPLLTLTAAIPLMVVNVGVSKIGLPFLGVVDIGLIYPLILIPIGVVGAANMVNMLAGYNGMETGMGIVYIGMLGLFAIVNVDGIFQNERYAASIIALIMFAALLCFYFFNKVPAKILPGDSLTYLLGGVLVSVAVIGNLEKAALILSIPFFIEFILKFRGNFKKQSYGYYYKGKVKSLYRKVYSIPHILTRTGKFTEREVAYALVFVELIFASIIWVIR